ncbi:MAG: ATP-binding protein [Bryobacteraceae bacterium]
MRLRSRDLYRLGRDVRRASRGLRFRLTATYASLFVVLLVGAVWLARAQLSSSLQTLATDSLDDDWTALKGSILRIDRDPDSGAFEAIWYYDEDDPDETTVVLDMKKVLLITDSSGKVILENKTKLPAESTIYQDLPQDSPAEIQERVRQWVRASKPGQAGKPFWMQKRDSSGKLFLIRAAVMWDEKRHDPFYVALGTSLAKNEEILRRYSVMIFAGVIPGAALLGWLVGWLVAGRALTPVRDVAQAAQRITGSNLGLRIPSRQAGDELDYLILTFNRMIERLEASFRQMKQFSADVSHELRTPITGIRGQLEVALMTAGTTDQYREAMFNALQDIDRLSQIVRALLLLSQAESGQLSLVRTRLDLGLVLEDLAEQFQIPAEGGGVRLAAQCVPGCYVDADRVQIERMITNLLSNALKFTPAGGEVRLHARPVEGNVELVVEDTGRGIPAEHLPHIFDRFYRVPGSGTAPAPDQGLGLGLSFVAWIAKAHNGVIDVQSTPGKGTRFIITLPAAGAAALPERATSPVGLA